MQGIFNELAEEHGFRRIEPHEFERFRRLHGTALLRELQLPLRKLPAVMSGMRRRMAQHKGQLQLFPGIAEALHGLTASGMDLGIASSNSRENVERVLGPSNARWIAHFACGASLFGKPAKLKQILRAAKLPREQTIYIGDEVRDGEAARSVGIAFGAVSWGQHPEDLLREQKPDRFFASVREMTEALKSEAS